MSSLFFCCCSCETQKYTKIWAKTRVKTNHNNKYRIKIVASSSFYSIINWKHNKKYEYHLFEFLCVCVCYFGRKYNLLFEIFHILYCASFFFCVTWNDGVVKCKFKIKTWWILFVWHGGTSDWQGFLCLFGYTFLFVCFFLIRLSWFLFIIMNKKCNNELEASRWFFLENEKEKKKN